MDSGASDTMFISKESFVEYHNTPSRMGDSAKAVDGNFEIVGEGKVVQRYLVDGKEKEITYTRALHTPTLNANLISVSSFDKAGLTTTFGNGHGVIRKSDGTVVLSGRNEKGMYIVNTIDGNTTNISNHPLAIGIPITIHVPRTMASKTHSLQSIDYHGNGEKETCRWVDCH